MPNPDGDTGHASVPMRAPARRARVPNRPPEQVDPKGAPDPEVTPESASPKPLPASDPPASFEGATPPRQVGMQARPRTAAASRRSRTIAAESAASHGPAQDDKCTEAQAARSPSTDPVPAREALHVKDQVASLLSEAETARAARRWGTAAAAYEKILEASPRAMGVWHRWVEVLAIQGRFNAVVSAHLHRLGVLESHGDVEGMADLVRRLLELQPDSVSHWAKRIEVYWLQGKQEKAIRLTCQLAPVAVARGHGDLAETLLRRAYGDDPERLAVGLELAETLATNGHGHQAQLLFRKVARTHLERNEPELAAEAFLRLSLQVPTDVELLYTLAGLYVKLGQDSAAEAQYRNLLNVDLKHLDALMGLARIYQRTAQYRDAVLTLNRIVRIQPDDLRAHECLGEVYRIQGMQAQAATHYLTAAATCLDCGASLKAQKLFQIVLEIEPNNATALRRLSQHP